MIDRNDMLELTRRLTPERSSVGRIAGAYFDAEGYVDGTFNINFLKRRGKRTFPSPRLCFFLRQILC